MAEPKYVTCGGAQHTFLVLPDSEADKRYTESGYFPDSECPECLDGDREYFRSHRDTCECQEDLCRQGNGCIYARGLSIVNEPLSGLSFLPVHA